MQKYQRSELAQVKKANVQKSSQKAIQETASRLERSEAGDKHDQDSSPGAVKIKVLAGEGNIASARVMAKRLVKMGYRVKLIDRAERSNFDVNTVYYAANQAATAEEIVKKLGKVDT